MIAAIFHIFRFNGHTFKFDTKENRKNLVQNEMNQCLTSEIKKDKTINTMEII